MAKRPTAATAKPARRGSRRAADTLAQREAVAEIFLLAEGEAKSMAVFSRRKDSQAPVIHLFGTAELCQRQGYGTALLQMLQKSVDGAEVFVEVATENIPAWWHRRNLNLDKHVYEVQGLCIVVFIPHISVSACALTLPHRGS